MTSDWLLEVESLSSLADSGSPDVLAGVDWYLVTGPLGARLS